MTTDRKQARRISPRDTDDKRPVPLGKMHNRFFNRSIIPQDSERSLTPVDEDTSTHSSRTQARDTLPPTIIFYIDPDDIDEVVLVAKDTASKTEIPAAKKSESYKLSSVTIEADCTEHEFSRKMSMISTPEKAAALEKRMDQFFLNREAKSIEPASKLSDFLENNFIVGEVHSHISAKKFLIQNMTLLKLVGFTTLFMEHLYYDEQRELESFDPNSESGSIIHERLDKLDHGYLERDPAYAAAWKQNNFSALVKAAKRVGIRIVAIDTSYTYQAQYLHKDPHTGESWDNYRIRSMNYTAANIMTLELAKTPGKWCALMGSAHIKKYQTILGVGELMGARTIFFNDDKRSSIDFDVKVVPELERVEMYVTSRPDESALSLIGTIPPHFERKAILPGSDEKKVITITADNFVANFESDDAPAGAIMPSVVPVDSVAMTMHHAAEATEKNYSLIPLDVVFLSDLSSKSEGVENDNSDFIPLPDPDRVVVATPTREPAAAAPPVGATLSSVASSSVATTMYSKTKGECAVALSAARSAPPATIEVPRSSKCVLL